MSDHYPHKFGDGAAAIGWAVIAFLGVLALVAGALEHPIYLVFWWVAAASIRGRAGR